MEKPRTAGTVWLLMLVSAIATTIVVVGANSLLVTEVTMCVALSVVIYFCFQIAREGRTPDGAPGMIIPSALIAWLLGHLVEVVAAALDPHPRVIGASDVAFTLALIVLFVVASRVWRQSAQYTDSRAMLRPGLDTLLIAFGVVCVYWQLVGLPRLRSDSNIVGVALAMVYVFLSSTVAGSQITRAFQRRDAGSKWLALSSSLAVAGVVLWSVAKFAEDLRVPGLLFMIYGVIVMPYALGHPSHQQMVVLRNVVDRDRMGALAFMLGCWTITYVALIGRVIDPVTTILAMASIVLIFARVFLVRSSEEQLVIRLQVLAFTDPLTGVGNRRSLLSQLERGGEGWLITIDLDGFKEVNDRYGHDAGDQVLVDFVNRMKAVLPSDAHLARIGGDEFGVLFSGTRPEALHLAESILTQARDPHYARLTASVGLTWHAIGGDPNRTVRDSDIAMQSAKRAGKDQLAVLTENMVAGRLRALEVGARLTETMNAIEVVYQPIVALSPGLPVVACEALARWNDPELGSVSPAEFIPIAEQQGLIVSVGSVVLEAVLTQARGWLDEGHPRQVSLNISWLQLRDSAVVDALARRFTDEPDLAPWIILEVTETVFSEDEAAVAAVRRLRDLGVSIAVDDFGTGVSNLRRLRTLPVDVLKIDKSLLDGVGDDPAADALLAMVNRLGESMGMTVLAEGVDNERTSRLLVEIGLTLGQGFLYARPMPASALPSPIPMMAPWLGRRARVAST